MSNIYFMCENCGIETNGITIVNGMKFCAKCYHQIFVKDNQQTEITQLKQQLTEKQNTIDEINKEFVQAVHDWKVLCADKDKELLKQKEKSARTEQIYNGIIVDKDKEIEKLKNLFKLNNEVVINQGKEIFDLRVQVLQQKQKQNQTQLAIQELEKVKEWLEPKYFDYEQINYLSKIIDQQIKELKGEK